MRVNIWGNPRIISNLNCLFWMHNWKWMNLSKMTSLNISLSVNERQISSDKKQSISLHLVLFFPFRCCFAGSLQFYRQWNKRNYSTPISEMFFTFFLREKLPEKNFSHWMCAKRRRLQGALSCKKKAGILARNSHTWLLIGRIIFLTRENTSFVILIGRIIFSRVKTIVRSSDWLELIFVWKFTI